jgi:hypothetical protein
VQGKHTVLLVAEHGVLA